MFSTFSRALVRGVVSLLVASALAVGVLALAPPVQAQKITPAFWGLHDNEWSTAPTVPFGSANFTTTGTYWPDVETSKGHFDFSRLDAQVAAAEGAGAQPMILLGQSPRFYSAKSGSRAYRAYMPNLTAWKRYVTKVAQRYGTRLDYQVWPEPNIIQNWLGTPRQMAQLTVVAAKAIQKAAGPKAKVVSPAVALRLASQQAWTLEYFKQKIGSTRVHQVLDAIAIDPFPLQSGTPEDSFKIMTSITKKLAHIGVHKPFWNNEINYGVAGGGDTTTTTYSVAKQQSYVIRTYVLSAAAKMQRTYWLAWFASPELAIDMTDDGGLTLPPARSYEVVRSWLNETNFQGCSQKKSKLWVCTAKAGGNEVRRIYWNPTGRTTIKTPGSTTRVEDQAGNVDDRGGAYRISVDFRPVMVSSGR